MARRGENVPLLDLQSSRNGAGRLQFSYAYALCRPVLSDARVRSTSEVHDTVALEWMLMVYDGGKNV